MKNMLIMLMLGVSACIAEKVPVEVQQVIDSAMAGKAHILSSFNEQAMSIGLDSGTKLSDLTAGEPFHFYGFDSASLAKSDENVRISSVIKPLDQWALPLFHHEKPRVLLWIVKNPVTSRWQVAGFGHSGYAKVWAKVCKAWPESLGYHPIFIGNLVAAGFFHVPEMGDNNLSHFSSVRLIFTYFLQIRINAMNNNKLRVYFSAVRRIDKAPYS